MTTATFKKTIATLLLSVSLAAGCAARPVSSTAPATPADPIAAPAQPAQADRAAVRARLAAARKVQLDRLRAYRDKGEFPRQQVQRWTKVNLFIDDDGRYCAMAHLISLSGEDQLVKQVALTNNTLRLKDVTEGPLMAWMLSSGLTQEEIDFVQEPYMYDEETPAMREQERRRLVDHFVKVEERLLRDWDASLDTATDRLLAAR